MNTDGSMWDLIVTVVGASCAVIIVSALIAGGVLLVERLVP